MDAKKVYDLIHKAAEKDNIRDVLKAGVSAIERAKELGLAGDSDTEALLSVYAHAMLMEYISTDSDVEPGFGQPVLNKVRQWLYGFALGFSTQAGLDKIRTTTDH